MCQLDWQYHLGLRSPSKFVSGDYSTSFVLNMMMLFFCCWIDFIFLSISYSAPTSQYIKQSVLGEKIQWKQDKKITKNKNLNFKYLLFKYKCIKERKALRHTFCSKIEINKTIL